MCGEQHVARGHSSDVELALPHGALPGEVAAFPRRQRRQRLLGDGVAVDRDENGPLREGALRRGVLQGDPQLGRLLHSALRATSWRPLVQRTRLLRSQPTEKRLPRTQQTR